YAVGVALPRPESRVVHFLLEPLQRERYAVRWREAHVVVPDQLAAARIREEGESAVEKVGAVIGSLRDRDAALPALVQLRVPVELCHAEVLVRGLDRSRPGKAVVVVDLGARAQHAHTDLVIGAEPLREARRHALVAIAVVIRIRERSEAWIDRGEAARVEPQRGDIEPGRTEFAAVAREQLGGVAASGHCFAVRRWRAAAAGEKAGVAAQAAALRNLDSRLATQERRQVDRLRISDVLAGKNGGVRNGVADTLFGA